MLATHIAYKGVTRWNFSLVFQDLDFNLALGHGDKLVLDFCGPFGLGAAVLVMLGRGMRLARL